MLRGAAYASFVAPCEQVVNKRISEEALGWVDCRTVLHKHGRLNQREDRRMGRRIQEGLKEDRKCRAHGCSKRDRDQLHGGIGIKEALRVQPGGGGSPSSVRRTITPSFTGLCHY